MQINKPARRKNKKIALIITAIIALIIGYGVFAGATNNWPFNSSGNSQESSDQEVNDVNYDQPTEEEVENSQDAKKRLLEESDDEQPQPSSSSEANKSPASVTISYADVIDGQLEVRAFTGSVIEGTGKCTATISKSGSQTITREVPAFIDASSTICEPIYIHKSQLSTGTWSVGVSYSSPTHQGSSGLAKVEVK